MSTITLGINSAYHEVAVAVVRDGVLVAAIEQERINRIKKGKVVTFESAGYLPYEAMDLALSIANAEFNDVDLIGFSYEPEKRYTSVTEYQYPYPIPASRGGIPPTKAGCVTLRLKLASSHHCAMALMSRPVGEITLIINVMQQVHIICRAIQMRQYWLSMGLESLIVPPVGMGKREV